MVYTDGIHMIADDLDELHQFAQRIGLKRCWFENKRGKDHAHYDLMINPVARLLMRQTAIQCGAVLVSKGNYAIIVNYLRNEQRRNISGNSN